MWNPPALAVWSVKFYVDLGAEVRSFGFFLERDEEGTVFPGKVIAIEVDYSSPEIEEFRMKLDEHKTSLFERLKHENSVRLHLLFE